MFAIVGLKQATTTAIVEETPEVTTIAVTPPSKQTTPEVKTPGFGIALVIVVLAIYILRRR